MHCNDAGQLMLAILDDEHDDGRALSEHLGECTECADAWRRLSQAEALLRSQHLVEPPPGFVESVSASLNREVRRLPAWQRRLAEVAWVAAGILVVVSALAALFASGRAVFADPRLVTAAGTLLRGTAGIAYSIVGAVDVGPLLWLLYGVLAVAMAMFWFGALIVPLHARRLVRSRA